MMNFQRARGFTLTELLTVIAVLAILMSLLLPVISQVGIHAKQSTTRSQILSLRVALDAYELEWGVFPPDGLIAPVTALKAGGGTYTVSNSTALYYFLSTPFRISPNPAKGEVWATKDYGPYLDANAKNTRYTGTGTEILDVWNRPLQYNNVSDAGFVAVPTTATTREIRNDPTLVSPDPTHPTNPARNLQNFDLFSMGQGTGSQCTQPIGNFKSKWEE